MIVLSRFWVRAEPQDELDSHDEPPALKSHATMDDEGMINVWVDLQKHLASMTYGQEDVSTGVERGIDQEGYDKCPPLNIVIFIVGSRGEQDLPLMKIYRLTSR